MATNSPTADHDRTEYCPDCNRDTPHSVSIEIRTEAAGSENSEFSREPYRVTECRVCGHASAVRMNDVASV
ncbi:MAG: hypothetical protein V5A37_02580 [Halobacteriales archaeon]